MDAIVLPLFKNRLQRISFMDRNWSGWKCWERLGLWIGFSFIGFYEGVENLKSKIWNFTIKHFSK